MLRSKDMTAGEIADKFHISWPSVSHHLELLKRSGLVISQKEGQFVYYSINTTVMDEIFKWVVQFSKKTKKK